MRSILAGVSAATLVFATVSSAFAGDRGGHHSDRWRDHAGYEHNSYRDNGYYNDRRYSNNHSNNRHYNDGHGYGGNQKRHHDGDNGTALGIGLGVVGLALVLGAMSSGNKGKNRDERDGWYRGDTNRRDDGSWRNPDGHPAYSDSDAQFSANDCLETREYQSRITVGGRNREAYGTACLTRSGQWLQGPPQLVPESR